MRSGGTERGVSSGNLGVSKRDRPQSAVPSPYGHSVLAGWLVVDISETITLRRNDDAVPLLDAEDVGMVVFEVTVGGYDLSGIPVRRK